MIKTRDKKICAFSITAAAFSLFPITVSAEEISSDIIERLYGSSHSDELISAVPDSARDVLDKLGFLGFMPNGTDGVTAQTLAQTLCEAVRCAAVEPLRVLLCIVGIAVLTSALDCVKSSGAADCALAVTTSLCTVSVAAPPVLSLVSQLAETIEASGNFMLVYVPVVSGLMIASGSAAGGTAYCGSMVLASSAVMQITSRVVLPLLKCTTALSVVSSSGGSVNLDGVISLFRKASRFTLTFCMSLFAAFLTMRSIVAASADSIANRAAKFAIGSFVPVVGGALSEAYQTVRACVSLLKSGVGAAALVVIFAIFVPALLRCAVWQAACAVGGAVCGLFGCGKTARLLGELASVVSVMFAVLLCTMALYTVSTAIVLIVGG